MSYTPPRHKLPPETEREILSAIDTVVVRQKAFRQPYLTLQEVADRCGFNRDYVSRVIKSRLGGFYPYINGLRMNYLAAYRNRNPGATLAEAIYEAGFASRQTYYSCKARMKGKP